MALSLLDDPKGCVPHLFGGSGDPSTASSGSLALYYSPTYFPPDYFAVGSAAPTAPTSGQIPYYAPTYFPPDYFAGGSGGPSVPTAPTSGQSPYYAPTYFPPDYFASGPAGPSSPTAPTSGQTPYNAPTYFPPAYFTGDPVDLLDPTPEPELAPGRDALCYAALAASVRATGAFDAVVFGDWTRRSAAGASSHPLAVITPKGWEEADDVDPIIAVRRVEFMIRLVIRVEDGTAPFDQLDHLAALVQAKVDHSDLNGQCLPALTKIRAGRYQPSSQYPEWSVELDGEFTLLIDPVVI